MESCPGSDEDFCRTRFRPWAFGGGYLDISPLSWMCHWCFSCTRRTETLAGTLLRCQGSDTSAFCSSQPVVSWSGDWHIVPLMSYQTCEFAPLLIPPSNATYECGCFLSEGHTMKSFCLKSHGAYHLNGSVRLCSGLGVSPQVKSFRFYIPVHTSWIVSI